MCKFWLKLSLWFWRKVEHRKTGGCRTKVTRIAYLCFQLRFAKNEWVKVSLIKHIRRTRRKGANRLPLKHYISAWTIPQYAVHPVTLLFVLLETVPSLSGRRILLLYTVSSFHDMPSQHAEYSRSIGRLTNWPLFPLSYDNSLTIFSALSFSWQIKKMCRR